jgi:hypothetical protein
MADAQQFNEFFKQFSKVLLRCWIFGFALLLVWFAVFLMAGESAHRLHAQIFGLAWHEMQLIFYCGMGLLKLFVLVFFFFPWLAIRLVLRGARS